MRATTNLFLINGTPLYAPDEEPTFSYEDIDSSETGRDEAGYMHRHVVRRKVGKWSFQYSSITDAEKQAIESIFEGLDTFQFTRPGRIATGTPETTECYRSKYSLNWKSSKTGKWVSYKFNIIEC